MKKLFIVLVLFFATFQPIQSGEKIVVKDNVEECDPNPLKYEILIKGFPYYSDANKRANYRYKWTSGDIRIVETFKYEASFNINAKSSGGARWLCQLIPNRTNNVRLKDPRRASWDFQAEVCLEKRLAVSEENKWKIRSAFKVRECEKENIIFVKGEISKLTWNCKK